MRENKPASDVWKSGGAAVNGWLAIPNSFSAETMAHQGWDSLTVDMQHGVVDYQAMVDDAAGDLDHRHRAGGARAVARARHPDEGARRRRLRRHLPDGQHARGRPEAWSPGPTTRRAARAASARCARRCTAAPTTPQHANDTIVTLRDDRDRAGARQPRRDPVGRRARRDLHRPVGPVAVARLHGRRWTTSTRRRRRRSSTSSRAPRRTASSPASTTARPSRRCERIAKGFQFVTVSSDARLMAAGAQQVLAEMRAAQPPGAPTVPS